MPRWQLQFQPEPARHLLAPWWRGEVVVNGGRAQGNLTTDDSLAQRTGRPCGLGPGGRIRPVGSETLIFN
jgi:hypothetical protein